MVSCTDTGAGAAGAAGGCGVGAGRAVAVAAGVAATLGAATGTLVGVAVGITLGQKAVVSSETVMPVSDSPTTMGIDTNACSPVTADVPYTTRSCPPLKLAGIEVVSVHKPRI